MSVANLEISLFSRAAGAYGIKLSYAATGSETEKRGSGSTPLTADDPKFLALGLDPASYGQYLASQLLADPAVSDFFHKALAVAQGQDAGLHIRLGIDRDSAKLHDLRWETLRLPGAAAPLLTGPNLTFSRYLDSLDFRPVNPRSASDIRALVVVADPSDVAQFSLAPVNQVEELDRAHTALEGIPSVELATRGQATLNNIVRSLRDGCDILFLVAHGVLARGEPWLFLEKEDGTADRVSGRELVTRIGELEDRPRLAVLASCQSAGTGQAEPTSLDSGALAGLGPRLAEAGVPAVIAMQGNVTMQTAADFIPAFFRELRQDGLADRAVAIARGEVRERPDWWMPVLFTNLKSGRLWEPASPNALPDIPRQPFEPETVYVRAGPFLMGSAPGNGIPDHETPQHQVILPAYRIGKYPVTVRQYAAFVKDKKDQDVPKDAGWFLREPPASKLDHPVTGVSWHDAMAYCVWLSNRTGRGYRLPSEAEWEKAARGPDGHLYPWGDEWQEGRCNVEGRDTTPVSSHLAGASAYYCQDMLGNVQEWTRSQWGSRPQQPDFGYPYNPLDGREIGDPQELPPQARLVQRGGSFKSTPADTRTTLRGHAAPDSKVPWRGFRVAMSV